ncbi:hypothetical protein [Desulfocicer niacini]
MQGQTANFPIFFKYGKGLRTGITDLFNMISNYYEQSQKRPQTRDEPYPFKMFFDVSLISFFTPDQN